MPTGVERIAAERQRQVNQEGWTPDHDDEHTGGSMAKAAACYAAPCLVYMHIPTNRGASTQELWPWDPSWDKRVGRTPLPKAAHTNAEIDARIRDLEKAGALCAAEIDRLQREKARRGLDTASAA